MATKAAEAALVNDIANAPSDLGSLAVPDDKPSPDPEPVRPIEFRIRHDGEDSAALEIIGDSGDDLRATMCSQDPAFANQILGNLCTLHGKGLSDIGEHQLASDLALLQGFAPRDPVEVALVTQMIAIHHAMMRAASFHRTGKEIRKFDSSGNALNKLARTFAAQVETLKKYRSTGNQKITVQHVNVEGGGQAIVAGSVSKGGGGKP